MGSKKQIKVKISFLELITSVLLAFAAVLCIVAFVIIPNYSRVTGWFNPVAPIDKSKDFITVCNVGEADATLICSNGQTVLVDTGSLEFDNKLSSQIYNLGIKKIDAVIISHLHADHAGGLTKIIEQFDVSNLIIPELDSEEESAFIVKKAKNDVLNNGGKVYTAVTGMVLNCGRFEITVLGYYSDMSDENNRSIILMAKNNEHKVLFMGDAEKAAEIELINNNINFDCDVLKVGHHGSDTSTCEQFLSVATPKYAVISCGVDNQYDHPDDEVIKRLSKTGAEVRRTDLHGNTTIHFYSDEIHISSEKLLDEND